jgi:hypothetical protein
MNDNEARGIILQKIHDLSTTGEFIDSAALTDLGLDTISLGRYLSELEQLNLITMKAFRQDSELVAAMIKLTPYGTRSIVHPDTAPPQVLIIGGDVHVGDRSTQEIKIGFGNVQAATSGSTITNTQQHKKISAIGRIVGLVKFWLFGS